MVSQNIGGREEINMIGNLVYNCSSDGILLHNSSDIKVILNTVYNCPTGIIHGWYGFSASVFNNIITECKTAIDFADDHSSASNSYMDYNLLDGSGNIMWDSTYADLAAFQAGTEHGDNCIEANPLFVDPADGNLRLQPASWVYYLELSLVVVVCFDRF